MLGVVQGLGEDDAVDLALGVRSGPPELPYGRSRTASRRRCYGVAVVDVGAVGGDASAQRRGCRAASYAPFSREAGDDRAVVAARVLGGEPQRGRVELARRARRCRASSRRTTVRVVPAALAAYLHDGLVDAAHHMRVGHDAPVVEDEAGALQDLAAARRRARHLDDGGLRAGGDGAARERRVRRTDVGDGLVGERAEDLREAVLREDGGAGRTRCQPGPAAPGTRRAARWSRAPPCRASAASSRRGRSRSARRPAASRRR
ncbi:hypothetical protein STENM223S_00808 [Streptomyces tendae]